MRSAATTSPRRACFVFPVFFGDWLNELDGVVRHEAYRSRGGRDLQDRCFDVGRSSSMK